MTERTPLADPADENGFGAQCWQVEALVRDAGSIARATVAANRLLLLASNLAPGSQISVHLDSDGNGSVDMAFHSRSTTHDLGRDLQWAVEDALLLSPVGHHLERDLAQTLLAGGNHGEVLELAPTVRSPLPDTKMRLPELVDVAASALVQPQPRELWPVRRPNDSMELLRALREQSAGLRIHIAPASPIEEQYMAAITRASVQAEQPERYAQYIGTSVRIRALAFSPIGPISPRLRAVLTQSGIGLTLLPLDTAVPSTSRAWNGHQDAMVGAVQPFGVAQCLLPIPASPETAPVVGIPTTQSTPTALPVDHVSWPEQGVRLGHATGAHGELVDIRIAPTELTQHTHVLGVPGTGKSTLLAAIAHHAIDAGYGVTILEGHGTLIDRVLDELPSDAIPRTLLVRSGDPDNPIPLNPVGPDTTGTLQQVMLEVLYEVFDHNRVGVIGPRFERIYHQMLSAQRHLIADRATIAAVPHLLTNHQSLIHLASALTSIDPDLAASVKSELADNSSSDFADLLAWVNSKFHRFHNHPAMRAITGTGVDAIDITDLINRRGVLLVDLASPTIGIDNATLLGEMWLAKHWAAMTRRSTPHQPHLLIIDEAQHLGTGILPRLLAEARKFGIAITLAHQHLEQLSPALRAAATASTSTVVAFRTGPAEAAITTSRLGYWTGPELTRLPTLTAAATIATSTGPSAPFTLTIDHNSTSHTAPPWAASAVTDATRRNHVDPYRDAPQITPTLLKTAIRDITSPARAPSNSSSFLDKWHAQRNPTYDANTTPAQNDTPIIP